MDPFQDRLSTLLMVVEEEVQVNLEVAAAEVQENITNQDLKLEVLQDSRLSIQPRDSLTTARSGQSTTGAWG